MHRRIAISLHWLRGRRNGVSAGELVRFLLAPPARSRARRLINAIREDAGIFRVHLVGIAEPLVWPKTVDLSWLYVALAEQGRRDDWHYYEIPETSVQPDDVVVDCGAAEGLFALRVAGRAKRGNAPRTPPLGGGCMHRTFLHVAHGGEQPFSLSGQPGRPRLPSRLLASRPAADGRRAM